MVEVLFSPFFNQNKVVSLIKRKKFIKKRGIQFKKKIKNSKIIEIKFSINLIIKK